MNYSAIYNSLIERAKTRVIRDMYTERHHVIPQCMGGTNNISNLVRLTPEEHFISHLLLVKIYPKHSGLVYAANMMCVSNGQMSRNNNKRYGWLKRRVAAATSSNLYGRRVIHKGEKKKYIYEDQIDSFITEGWKLGIPTRSSKTNKKLSESKKRAYQLVVKEYYKLPQFCSVCNNVLPYASPFMIKKRQRLKSNCGSSHCRSVTQKRIAEARKKPLQYNKCKHCNTDTINPKFCNLKCSNNYYAIFRQR